MDGRFPRPLRSFPLRILTACVTLFVVRLASLTAQPDHALHIVQEPPASVGTGIVFALQVGNATPDTSNPVLVESALTALALEFQQEPSDADAGAIITPAITVRAVDMIGITDLLFTDDITISIGNNPGGGTLSGTTTVAAVNGVATFDDISIDKAGSGYTLTATSTVSPANSETFDISPGPASGATSQITASPTSIPADGSSQSTITVELRDAEGNPLTSGGDVVALSKSAGSLSPVIDLGDGSYQATLTSSSTAGTATVSGTVNGNTITDTADVAFTAVGPGPPSGATSQITAAPTSIPANGTSQSTITVQLRDASNTPLTTGGDVVVLSESAGSLSPVIDLGDGSYQATLTSSSTAETATVSGTVNGNAITDTATVTFTAVGPGPPSGLTSQITAAPTSIPADGTSTSTITVQLRDANNEPLTTGGADVQLSKTAGSLSPVFDNGNGTYSATLTSSSSTTNVTATVSGTVNGSAITDTAVVTFTGVTPVATRLEFGQQPSNAQAGASIAPPITVRAVDNGGATVTSFTGNISIAIGNNPGGGTLSGTTTVPAVNGVATFGNLSINRTGTGYTLTASSSGLTGATSNAFTITPGPPSGATSQITAVPTSIPANGTSTSTITVELRDAAGNSLTAGGATVVLSTTEGSLGPVTDQGNGRYTAFLTSSSSTTTVIATVSGTVNPGGAITDTAAVTFTAVAPVATRLLFGQQPTQTQAGAAITPPVTVRAVDNAGATVTSFTGNVTIAIGTNPGGGTLSGTATVAAVGGVATFSNLSINRNANGYTLTAGASGLAGATSSPFTITPGPPSGATSTITAAPTSVPADGGSTSVITVELRDVFGNRRTSGGSVVTLSTTAGSLGPVIDLGDGTYTATLTAPSAPGTATITGTVNGASIADNATVTFTTAPPNTLRLAFVQQPGNTQAGLTISPPVTVRVVDLAGATVTSFSGQVTIAISVNPAGGTLAGTTTVTAVGGVATFSSLSIARAGVGYRLAVGASGITGATSEPFTILPGPAFGPTTLITAEPTSIPADGTSTATITVEVRDAQGNRRTTGGDSVTLATSLGILSAVTDLGNGTYSAILRSSTTAGTATITGTVAGATIVDTATVTFTSSGSSTATRLVFGQQPGNAQIGAAISPPVTVHAVDGAGATATTFTGNVTIALGLNPTGAVLSGTTTVAAVAGVATFGNLMIDRAGSYTLVAGASGLTGVTSNSFTISATPPPTTADLAITASVDDATPAVGDTVVYTIRVTNQGPAQATGVQVSYQLSDRLAFVSSVPSLGSYNPQTEIWTVGTIESGAGATLEISARVQR
jgi:adhesin/invasin